MRDVLSGIAGIGVYPTISLVLFTTVFAGVLWRVSRLARRDVDRLGALPLDDEPAAGAGTGDPS